MPITDGMSLALFLFGVAVGGALGWGLATLWVHPWNVAAALDRWRQERSEEEEEEVSSVSAVMARRRSTLPARAFAAWRRRQALDGQTAESGR